MPPPFAAISDAPYSLTNHLAVGGSISSALSSSPWFLQNSSNDLSVTNGSTTRSLPAEIQACIWDTGTPRRFAARSQEYASSSFASAAAILSMVEESRDARILSQSTAREFADMRGSRTFSMPIPMSRRSLGRLTRRVACRVLSDHPSVTFPLIPSAPSRQRTARSERPSRRAIFFTGSYPAKFNNLASCAGVHSMKGGLLTGRVPLGIFALVDWPSAEPANSVVFRRYPGHPPHKRHFPGVK